MTINIYPDPEEYSLLTKIQEERAKLREETNRLLEHSRNNIRLHVYGIFMTIMFLLLLIIASTLIYATYNTLSNTPTPIEFSTNVVNEAYQHDDYTVFSSANELDVKRLMPVSFNRELLCKTSDGVKYTYDIPAVKMFLQPGHYKDSKKFIILPLKIPIGSVCTLKTVISWSEKIAWDLKYYNAPDVIFKVDKEKFGHICNHVANEFTE